MSGEFINVDNQILIILLLNLHLDTLYIANKTNLTLTFTDLLDLWIYTLILSKLWGKFCKNCSFYRLILLEDMCWFYLSIDCIHIQHHEVMMRQNIFHKELNFHISNIVLSVYIGPFDM